VTEPDTLGTRRSIYELVDDRDNGKPEELDALMRAWKGIQDLPPTNPNSFFVIGGYHGEPFRGAGTTDGQTWWGGYCEHGTVLFPTWHRAYLHRLEKALQTIRGCKSVMQPFWDECNPRARTKGVPVVFTDPTYKFADGKTIPNPLKSYTLPVAIEDQVTNEVPGECSEYSKPKGYSTVRYPLSGLVGNATDLAATEAHNAKYPDDEQRTKDLNEIVRKWLKAVPYQSSSSSPPSTQGYDYWKFLQSLKTPTYTLFSNTTSQNAWNAAQQGDQNALVYALENPHNNMHLAIGGIDIPNYARSLLPGANGDMGENDTAALDPIFYFHHCFIDYVFWTWQRRNGAAQWFDIDPTDPGAIATPPNAQAPAGRGQNEQLSMDSPLNPFRTGDGPTARAVTSRDVVDIGNLGYQYAPGSLDRYANPDTPIPPFPSGPVVYVSGINRARIAGSFVIAAHAEIDGKKQLLGYEAVLSRWHVAGCANCQLHLESKAAFPVSQHLQEKVASLAKSRPETITASVHTREGLHGGVPLPIDAHVLGPNTPFKVELLRHDPAKRG
jgi:tyrosinase